MMLMAMRPQKSQLTSLYKYTAPGAATFTKRDAAIMHGYTDFDVMVVGAAGGRSGNSGGFVSGAGNLFVDGAGGGGGGSMRVKGSLKDLLASEPVTVGGVGSTGGNVGTGVYAGNGGVGGSSSFGTHASATGGNGGIGGREQNLYPTGGVSEVPSKGGTGGVGAGATAGTGGQSNGYAVATSGNWVDDGNGGGSGGGGGGGGGAGLQDGSPRYAATAGESGANTAPYSQKSAGEGVQSSFYGGGGGGANIAPVTGGAAEYYGTGWNTAGKRDGAVVIKLS